MIWVRGNRFLDQDGGHGSMKAGLDGRIKAHAYLVINGIDEGGGRRCD